MKKEKKHIKKDSGVQKELSASKKKLFWIITILLPVFLFIILEITLRVINYGGNLSLFINGPPGYESYYTCNPAVAKRYFYGEDVPTIPLQLFRKEKPGNGFRIFVLGGSSAAGFPYSSNVSFPGMLRMMLNKKYPGKEIEVINVSMSAVNSYTLLDLLPEILEQSPDLLLIYAGHNEYYGALGVGSVQSLGSYPGLIRTYLNLQSIRTVRLLRDFVGWLQIETGSLIDDKKEIDATNTLMARIVAEQVIPYGGHLYEAGKEQFEANLEAILSGASENKVPVLISELVCNLHDQEPFISVKDEEGTTAQILFEKAKLYEVENDIETAKEYYTKAKDYDALRFRAPEEFNSVIRKLASKYNCFKVPALSYFEKVSTNGIIGQSLILEHLHPNKKGYVLLAKAFYDTIVWNNLISENTKTDSSSDLNYKGMTELDSVYAALVIKHLKGGWPFKPKSKKNLFYQLFKPEGKVEEIAFKVMLTKDYNLEAAHMELGGYYESEGEYDKAFNEYYTLISSIPQEIEFYEKASTVLIKQKKYKEAVLLLQKSLTYKQNDFAYKWIGQIALMKGDYKDAVTNLSHADMKDEQVLFNLSRAYYEDNQWYNGELYFDRLKRLSLNAHYLKYLNKLRIISRVSE